MQARLYLDGVFPQARYAIYAFTLQDPGLNNYLEALFSSSILILIIMDNTGFVSRISVAPTVLSACRIAAVAYVFQLQVKEQ